MVEVGYNTITEQGTLATANGVYQALLRDINAPVVTIAVFGVLASEYRSRTTYIPANEDVWVARTVSRRDALNINYPFRLPGGSERDPNRALWISELSRLLGFDLSDVYTVQMREVR